MAKTVEPGNEPEHLVVQTALDLSAVLTKSALPTNLQLMAAAMLLAMEADEKGVSVEKLIGQVQRYYATLAKDKPGKGGR